MQLNNGQIYCAILAASLETVVFKKEGAQWHEPVLIRRGADKKEHITEPLTGYAYIERVFAPDPVHILTHYRPGASLIKEYKQLVKKYRQTVPPPRDEAKNIAGGIASATVTPK